MYPSEPASNSQPGPTDSTQSLVAHLEDVMAQAEIAANAQRDIESGAVTPIAETARQEAPNDDEGDEDDDSIPGEEPQDEGEDEGEESDEGSEEGEEPEPKPPAEQQAEQPHYSRRDAARFATELAESKKKLDEYETQLRSHQGELAHFRASDQAIRNHLQEQSGYVREQNGRFRYENLSEKVLKGTASQEEADEVSRMTSWHEFAAPIFRAAEEMVLGSMSVKWGSLKDLEGVGDQGLAKLNAAPDSIQGAKELHALAYAAGQAKAESTYKPQVAKLQSELRSLKTRKLSSGPQPATTNGAAVPGKGGFLDRAIDPKTGLTNPDFDREVAAGKWLGADLSQS